jgi:predicted transcriptional regulator
MYSVTKNTNKNVSYNRNELLVTFKGVKYGAFAGFVATWSISSVIVLTELLLGLNIGAFYSIMGISLGITDITTATSTAFGLHLLVGTIIGALFGAIGIRWKKVRMLNPYKSSLVGMGAGILLWLILFLPITLFLVQPAINSITTIMAVGSQQAVFSEDVNQSIGNITFIAISFHLIWGAIFGIIVSSLLRIRLFKIKQHYRDIINIDPNIRLVTICDSQGNTMYSRHGEGVSNLLTPEESKKSIEMAMTGWKVRGELSNKIGRGRYVIAEYEKIKRITMPFGEDYLLYLTTEPQANHLNIINRIRKLEAGLKYSFS